MNNLASNTETISDCVWEELFTDDERKLLQEGFQFTGILAVMFSFWITVTLLFTNLRKDTSYRTLANFTLAECLRRLAPTLFRLVFVQCIKDVYIFNNFSCQLFAFVETFLAIFEVECLTHLCIDRYVVAKYITNGWEINRNHYYLYLGLCLFFSLLYSVPPILGVGDYNYDFDCTSFTFNMILPETWMRYFVVSIFILRGVKPFIFMTIMLIWARILERKLPCPSKAVHQYFTQRVLTITAINLVCWAPITLIRANVIFSYFLYSDFIYMPPGCYIMWAMWIHWVAPVPTVIALLASDERICHKIFSLREPNEETLDNNEKMD